MKLGQGPRKSFERPGPHFIGSLPLESLLEKAPISLSRTIDHPGSELDGTCPLYPVPRHVLESRGNVTSGALENATEVGGGRRKENGDGDGGGNRPRVVG
uniref:Uncharacterized protein n=1 Tax=Vespula pensylvanica TaxID=30213 RepID=A0A834KG28_VESPE|nr:hypothetical protein H0235_014853 [Vespula pensylvanica]